MARLKKPIKNKSTIFLDVMYRDGTNTKTFFTVPILLDEYIEIMGQRPKIGAEFEAEQFGLDPELIWELAFGYDEEVDHNILEIVGFGYENPNNQATLTPDGLQNSNLHESKLINEVLTKTDLAQINSLINLRVGSLVKSEISRLEKDIKAKEKKQEKTNTTVDTHIKDAEQHLKKKDVEAMIKAADKQLETDIEKLIKTELDSLNKNRNFEKSVQDITAQTLVNFYRTMWVKRGFWQNNLVK